MLLFLSYPFSSPSSALYSLPPSISLLFFTCCLLLCISIWPLSHLTCLPFSLYPVLHISSVSLQTVSLKSVDGMGLFAPVRWRRKRELSLVTLWTVSGPSGLLHSPRSVQEIMSVMAFNPRLILSEFIHPFWNSYDLKSILCFYFDDLYSAILKST